MDCPAAAPSPHGVATPVAAADDPRLPELLARRLAGPLPGWPAQRRFETELAFGRHHGPAPTDARLASVVVLLYPRRGAWHLPLIVRTSTMADHAGQIALPGGAIGLHEPSRVAALRELEEELGVAASAVTVLGPLTPLYVFSSNFVIQPWLAWRRDAPRFEPSPAEVAELLEVPLAHLLDRSHYGVHVRRHRGVELAAPHIQVRRHRIWGATGMVLAELAALIESLAGSNPITDHNVPTP